MGLLTTVKETILGDAVGERANDRRSPVSTVESVRTSDLTDVHASEADYVLSTGRSRTNALLELVEAHGGRVKQAELVRLTGWSKSTVSRHLSELEDDGAIERVPVGRYKVVLLPDESLFGDHSTDSLR